MSREVVLVVVEGALEVPASLRLLRAAGVDIEGLHPVDKGGRIAFWRDLARYNRAAAQGPVFGLADLEAFPCPSGLIAKHLKKARHPDFIMRVAERMLESWLLADTSLARFLGVSAALLPKDPDAEPHPKRTLVNLARRARARAIRNDLVPEKGSMGIVGKGYTPRMTEFVQAHWRPEQAQARSESLRRAIEAIRRTLLP